MEKENEIRSEQCATTSAGLISLIGGAGLGALLMYLFDPNEGKGRREYVAGLAEEAYHKGEEALHKGGEALGATWHTLRDKGAEYGKASYEAMSDAASHLSAHASHISDHASDLAAKANLGGYRKRISSRLNNINDEASDRLDYLLHGNPNRGLKHGWSQALAATGCIALGFGAMYLMDPVDGARRRNMLRDRFLATFNRLGRSIDHVSRDLFNRTTGTLHEARAGFSREEVSDRVLEDRVRAAIGHQSSSARNITVEASNGSITLGGMVPSAEVDCVLRAVWSTRGVSELINRLNIGPAGENPRPSTYDLPREGSTANAGMGSTTGANSPLM